MKIVSSYDYPIGHMLICLIDGKTVAAKRCESPMETWETSDFIARNTSKGDDLTKYVFITVDTRTNLFQSQIAKDLVF